MLRNSARNRSSSSSGARSCMVTTMETTAPSSAWIGVALTNVVTRRPSGTESTISSARTVVALLSACGREDASMEISRPSARRQDRTSSSCSGERPGRHSPPTIRFASRLSETGWPVRASRTTTPTGEVSTRASRSARARCSARCRRALAIAASAWDANSAKTSRRPLTPPRRGRQLQHARHPDVDRPVGAQMFRVSIVDRNVYVYWMCSIKSFIMKNLHNRYGAPGSRHAKLAASLGSPWPA